VTRAIATFLIAAALTVSLGACGRRGDPEVPAGQKDTLTTTVYPGENACSGTDCGALAKPKAAKPDDNSNGGNAGNAQ